MCGIAGIRAFTEDFPAADEQLGRICDALRHRGPDDAGLWRDPSGMVALGHRRLSIIDLSAAGHQPMSNEDGTVWTVFNGEIYNFARTSAGELERRGHRFSSATDTEVIVHLYEDHGADFVDHLRGMFAIALLDTRTSDLLLARDRLGVKPLYYASPPGGLVFASEATALLAHSSIAPELDEEALSHYLAYGSTPPPLTLLRGVSKLAPAERLLVRPDGSTSRERYWSPFNPAMIERLAAAGDGEIERELLQRLRDSVELRMLADVPVGVFLSGGLDSSTNVALMAELVEEPVSTFSIAAAEHPDFSELPYARQVAERFGTAHHEVLIGEEDFAAALPGVIDHQDEPNPDWASVGTYLLAREARAQATPVIQLGEGADELFHGYDEWHSGRRGLGAFASLPAPARAGLGRLAAGAGRPVPRLSRAAEAIGDIGRTGVPFWGGAMAFRHASKARLAPSLGALPDPAEERLVSLWSEPESLTATADSFQRMTYVDLKQRLAETLLMRVDKMLMAASVEGREPFLDHELVEFALATPPRLKYSRGVGKRAYRNAVSPLLPREIVERRKQGFSTPVPVWLRGELGRRLERAIDGSRLRERVALDPDVIARLWREHRSGQADHSYRLWLLWTVCAWYDRWIG